MLEYLTKWRRDLHSIPELGLQEFKTKEYLKEQLIHMGYQPMDLLDTGLYVYIDYCQERTIAFRSDIDALSVGEENDVNFKSTHQGVMHACGHDGHMSALLGLAYALKNQTIESTTNILLIFQPAEESPGAAKDVVGSGVFEKYNVEAIFGIHIMPLYEHGKIVCKSGPLMAKCGEMDVEIIGKGAHAGLPSAGIDSLVIASTLIQQYQQVVSRMKSPFEPVVLNIGKINGGTARNSVAEKTTMNGTVRCYSDETFDQIISSINSIHEGAMTSYGCKIHWSCPPLYPALINNERLFDFLCEISDVEVLKEPLMLAEDFSYYTQHIDGLFIYVGSKTKDYQSGLHTSTFNFDEDLLKTAVDLYIKIIKNYRGK